METQNSNVLNSGNFEGFDIQPQNDIGQQNNDVQQQQFTRQQVQEVARNLLNSVPNSPNNGQRLSTEIQVQTTNAYQGNATGNAVVNGVIVNQSIANHSSPESACTISSPTQLQDCSTNHCSDESSSSPSGYCSSQGLQTDNSRQTEPPVTPAYNLIRDNPYGWSNVDNAPFDSYVFNRRPAENQGAGHRRENQDGTAIHADLMIFGSNLREQGVPPYVSDNQNLRGSSVYDQNACSQGPASGHSLNLNSIAVGRGLNYANHSVSGLSEAASVGHSRHVNFLQQHPHGPQLYSNANNFINMDESNSKKPLPHYIHPQHFVFKTDQETDGNGNYSQIHQNPHGIPSQHNQLNQHQHLSSLHHGDGINSGASTSHGSPPLVGAGGGLILPSAQPAVNQYCAICKDRATGKHYGAASCDGCKGFFRRSVRKNHSYSCRYGRNCVVDKDKRNQCRFCRLRKCFKAGMKREAVQNERDRISNRRPSYEDQSNNTGISLQTLLQADNRYIETEMDLLPMDDVEDSSQCIRIDNKRVATVSDIGRAMKGQVTALVDWVKNVPAILDLRMDDKVALVRAHSGDHLLLNLIRRSIQEKDCLLLSNHYMIHRTMGPSPITRVAARILDLVEAMRDNLVDGTEFACLKAVIFLDPSVAGLTEKSKVQQLRHQVLINLEDYVCDRQYDGRGRYGELLMTVPVLHSITSQMIEMIQLARAQGQIDIDNLLEEMLLGGSGHYGDASSSSDQSPAAANPSGLFLNPNTYVPILQGMNPADHQQQQQQHQMVQDLHLSQSHAHHSLANIQHIIPQSESNVVTSSTSSTSSSPEGAGRILPDQQSQHANVVVRGPDGNELVVSSGNDVMQHSQNHQQQQRPMTDREAMQVLLQNQPQQLHAHARNNQQQRLQLQQRHHNSPDQRDNPETNETGNGQSFKTEVMDVERTYQ